jgi:hypothetical protein
VRTHDEVRHAVRETIVDNATGGADWVEIQVDPTSYAERLGGEAAVVETVLAAADGRVGVILETTPIQHRQPRTFNDDRAMATGPEDNGERLYNPSCRRSGAII